MDRDELEQHLAQSECRITRGTELIDRQVRVLADLRGTGIPDDVARAEQLLASFEATLTETVATRDFFRWQLTELLDPACLDLAVAHSSPESAPSPALEETAPPEHSFSFESSSREESRGRRATPVQIGRGGTRLTLKRSPSNRRSWLSPMVRRRKT